ncbi:hypothetical protein C2G38_2065496, partial [Gigaspora rosea]
MCMGFCTDSFTPGGRSGHESVLIENKLYIMGGFYPISQDSTYSQTNKFNISREFFYLDLSISFDIDSPPFVDLTSTSPMLYGVSKGAALAGGISKSYIFLIGGTR